MQRGAGSPCENYYTICWHETQHIELKTFYERKILWCDAKDKRAHRLVRPLLMLLLYRPCDKAPYLICRGLLHSGGGMSVGVQGEARRVVAQDAGDRLGVHAVLDGQGGIGVAEIMEADILCDARFLAQGLVKPSHAVGTVHLPGDRGGEHDRVEGVLTVLLDQQLHRFLGEKHLADAVGRLGWADPHLAFEPAR